MSETYRTELSPLTIESASVQSRPLLEDAQRKLGFVPNMYQTMANLSGLLETYQIGYQRFRDLSGFSALEQEIVFLVISFANGCDYCMAAHSMIAADVAHTPAGILEALREGRPLPDPKLEALAGFTRHLFTTRGRPEKELAKEFLAAGFTDEHILAIILAIAVKTLSNYTNHLFEPELDEAFAKYKWTSPKD